MKIDIAVWHNIQYLYIFCRTAILYYNVKYYIVRLNLEEEFKMKITDAKSLGEAITLNLLGLDLVVEKRG